MLWYSVYLLGMLWKPSQQQGTDRVEGSEYLSSECLPTRVGREWPALVVIGQLGLSSQSPAGAAGLVGW